MRVLLAVSLAGLALVSAASANDDVLRAVSARYLPPAQRAYADDADGLQARYDAGRALEEAVRATRVSAACAGLRDALLAFARAQVARAEAGDYPIWRPRPVAPGVPSRCRPRAAPAPPAARAPVLSLPASAVVARPEGTRDSALSARLAAIGSAYRGWAGFWVHDLRKGRTAGWNSDARFAAGSAVKLGPLLASLPRASLAYDAEQLARWSSNLAANRILAQVGLGAVGAALRRLGMWSSTYPGFYRAGTSASNDAPNPPPLVHARVTTAHDLGRALYRLHAAAIGNRLAVSQLGVTRPQARRALALLLASLPVGENRGLLRPWLAGVPVAQKNAWISDLRATAAIVYAPSGPMIVVVEASRPGITGAEARALGRQVLRAVGL